MLKNSWLNSAIGSYSRAASALDNEVKHSDLDVAETCRNINDRIMRVNMASQSQACICATPGGAPFIVTAKNIVYIPDFFCKYYIRKCLNFNFKKNELNSKL